MEGPDCSGLTASEWMSWEAASVWNRPIPPTRHGIPNPEPL